MKTKRRLDPLLAVARLALVLCMATTGFITAAFAIATPAALIMSESIMAQLASRGGPPETIWAVIGVLALSGLVAGLGFFFFRDLHRIVTSVEQSNPFVPVNARRLQSMGWIAVAVHVLGVPLAMTSHWLERIVHHDGRFEFSYFGLLLALVLFVLARVFREGTRLAEEVEGIV